MTVSPVSRGIKLNADGLRRLEEAISTAALTNKVIAFRSALSINTVRAIRHGHGVDLHSLQSVFQTLALPLRPQDYVAAAPAGTSGTSVTSTEVNFSLSNHRTAYFVGREMLLEQMQEILNPGNDARQSLVLTGLGGIGKTQLALAYANRFLSYYNYIFRVTANSATALKEGYREIAALLRLREAFSDDAEESVWAVKHWLNKHTGWLLLLDPADFSKEWTPAHLKASLPTAPHGRYLITSRSPYWVAWKEAHILPLEVFTPQEAKAFFDLFVPQKSAGEATETAMQHLAQALGYLPLALEQVGSSIRNRLSATFSNWLSLYQRHENWILESGRPETTDYPHTLQTVWNADFQAIRNEYPLALDLLAFSAFLDPASLPWPLLRAAQQLADGPFTVYFCESQTEDEADYWWDTALEALCQYSLLEWNAANGSYRVHRLIQAVVRGRMSQAERRQWLEWCGEALMRIVSELPHLSENRRHHWIKPHIRAYVGWIKKEGLESTRTAYLLEAELQNL